MSRTASLGPGREALKYFFPDGETDSDGETLQMELPELPQLVCVVELAFNRGLSYSMPILFSLLHSGRQSFSPRAPSEHLKRSEDL